jgi:pyrroloquinoline quinone (PQQ) biosynthesis protein C
MRPCFTFHKFGDCRKPNCPHLHPHGVLRDGVWVKDTSKPAAAPLATAKVAEKSSDGKAAAAEDEFSTMKMSELRQLAEDSGVSKADIKQTKKADQPKDALIELLRAAGATPGGGSSAAGPDTVTAAVATAASTTTQPAEPTESAEAATAGAEEDVMSASSGGDRSSTTGSTGNKDGAEHDYGAMKMSELRQLAEDSGVSKADIKQTKKADQPKDALIALLRAAGGGSPATAAAQPSSAPASAAPAEAEAVADATPASSPAVSGGANDGATAVASAAGGDYSSMKMSELRQLAEDSGVSKADIKQTKKADQPKDALITLLRAAGGSNPATAAAQPSSAPASAAPAEAEAVADATPASSPAVSGGANDGATAVASAAGGDYSSMKMSELRQLAEDSGVSKADIKQTKKADQPKDALIALLLSKAATTATPAAQARQDKDASESTPSPAPEETATETPMAASTPAKPSPPSAAAAGGGKKSDAEFLSEWPFPTDYGDHFGAQTSRRLVAFAPSLSAQIKSSSAFI